MPIFTINLDLNQKLLETTDGHGCAWCSKLAGVYTYPNVDRDVYRRHDNCTCTVDYQPGNGKRQDVWTKKWSVDSKK